MDDIYASLYEDELQKWLHSSEKLSCSYLSHTILVYKNHIILFNIKKKLEFLCGYSHKRKLVMMKCFIT